MILAGIIAEYNPFHAGHEFHIQRTKELTGADCAAVVLSGNFVQRGEPAVMDKFLRAKCALCCGADLVIELPLQHSLSSAEQFACGALFLLNALRADYLSFGSECGCIGTLTDIARLLLREPPEYKKVLKNALSAGMSFPRARDAALCALNPDFNGILSAPNNTLGIEYIREIQRKAYKIQPVTLQRTGAGYHDSRTLRGQLPSATALRALLQNNRLAELSAYVPKPVFSLMQEHYQKSFPICADDFSSLLYYRLSMLVLQNVDLTDFCDVSPSLANRIANMMKKNNQPRTFMETADFLKTKDITHSRIMRCLMHILLDIHNGDILPPSCIRILGLNETGKKYLSSIKKDCPLPIITKPAAAKELLKKEIYSSDIYNQAVYDKYNTTLQNDYTHNIIQCT